jgi:hypothetical protein
VVTRARLARWALVAAPFMLLAVGTWALWTSPWPAVLGLTLKGQHVFVPMTWRSVGRGALAAVSYLGALGISFTIKREGEG